MKLFSATALHTISIVLITFSSFGEEMSREPRLILFSGGLFLFYISHALILKESWRKKEWKDIKILKIL